MEANVPCGPYDRSLLSFQDEHVSTDIWAGNDRGKLNIRQGTSRLLDWEINQPQRNYIEAWGFRAFCQPSNILQNDIGLISALVERWRPETNSFHFPFGEITITLEDVYMLLGLPVRGKPIIYEELANPKPYWIRNWPDPNLSQEEKKALYGNSGVSLKKLRQRYSELPEDADDDTVRVHSLAYVLYVIGSVLFPSTSQDVVHPKYLQLLLQPDDISSYAWGAGVLGYLYKSLYKASRKESTGTEGCLSLLQLWSYERLLPGRPEIAPDQVYTWPRALAWAEPVEDRYENPHHHLRVYRGYFDSFDPRWVTWQPYAHFYMTEFHEFEVGRHSGLARVPLIHWNIVEYQMPDRVLRQFGMLQHIPGPPFVLWERRMPVPRFHRENYIVTLAAYVHEWEQFSDRGANVVGQRDYCPIEDYMRWYIRVTKLKISRYDDYDPRIIQQPRDWCNQLDMVNTMMSAVSLLDDIHHRDPPDYFYDLIPGFLSHYDKVMTEMHGPGFERPTFHRRAPREVVEPTVPHVVSTQHDVPFHMSVPMHSDVVDPFTPVDLDKTGPSSVPMDFNTTGPSTSSVPMEFDTSGPSVSPFLKFPPDYYLDKFGADTPNDMLIDAQRGGEDMKGVLKRQLKSRKSRWLYANWWNKEVEVEDVTGLNLNYCLKKNQLMTLMPKCQVEDVIVNAYFELLKERETRYIKSGEFVNVVRHFFMPSEFMELAKGYVQDLKRHPLDRSQEDLQCMKSFLLSYAGHGQFRGEKIEQCESIYFPTCHDNHWFIFIWSLVDQKIVLLDSLRNDAKYMKLKQVYNVQYYIVEKLVPCMLHFVDKKRFPLEWGKVRALKERPMQTDLDCGIFLCKYVDASLMGLSLENEHWSKEDICNFRYRIAWEIKKGEARHLPQWSIDWRNQFPRQE